MKAEKKSFKTNLFDDAFAVLLPVFLLLCVAFLMMGCTDKGYPCPKPPTPMVVNRQDGSYQLKRVTVPLDKHGLVKKKTYYSNGN